jgi:hypothetical protein
MKVDKINTLFRFRLQSTISIVRELTDVYRVRAREKAEA